MEQKQADRGRYSAHESSERRDILAMANVPEFHLNEPFTLNGQGTDTSAMTDRRDPGFKERRCGEISASTTPTSRDRTFKIITAAAGLEEGVVVTLSRYLLLSGIYRVVEDRRIHCHKRAGHGSGNVPAGGA
jgi:stage V sporulation protein D (sporulation-specific penicillin-binding protein)